MLGVQLLDSEGWLFSDKYSPLLISKRNDVFPSIHLFNRCLSCSEGHRSLGAAARRGRGRRAWTNGQFRACLPPVGAFELVGGARSRNENLKPQKLKWLAARKKEYFYHETWVSQHSVLLFTTLDGGLSRKWNHSAGGRTQATAGTLFYFLSASLCWVSHVSLLSL